MNLFPEFDSTHKKTPKCDDVTRRLQSGVMKNLHNKCVTSLKDIQFKHNLVVFLAERVLPLMVYAEILAKEGSHDKVHMMHQSEMLFSQFWGSPNQVILARGVER